MEMDANVWSNLALDLLLFHILPHLSLFERLALRSVCRHWKTLLVSKSYVERSQITSPLNSSCIIIWSSLKPRSLSALKPGMHKIQVFFYEHFSDKWLPLRALMPTQLPHKVDPSSFVPISSAHGLLCFQNMRYGSRKRIKLSVCNPTLNQWMNLPPLISTELIYKPGFPATTTIHSSFVSLVPKEGGPGFYLILAGLSKLWMFDSAMSSWKEINCDNLFESECYKDFRGVLVIGKIAYILTTESGRVNHDESIFLLKYDINEDHISRCATLEDKMWSDLDLLFHRQLVELNEHVIMMGYNEDIGLYLWKFHTTAMEWSFFKSIQGPSWNVDVYYAGHFNVIKVHNLIYFHQHNMHSHDVFNMETNEWKRLADFKGRGPCYYERVIFSFRCCNHSLVDAIPQKRKRNGRIKFE